MKSSLRFYLFVILPLLWLGVFVNSGYAQQLVTVSPEVKADALSRLELAKSAQIPKDKKQMGHFYGEDALRICNKGPKPSDIRTQERACSGIVAAMANPDDAMPRSLDDLLPAFKACAITYDCSASIKLIAQSGHPDYALALAEFAPNCKGCVVLGELVRNSTGALRATLYLAYSQKNMVDNDPVLSTFYRAESQVWTDVDSGHSETVYKKAKEYIEIGDSDDVRRLLERGCTEAGRLSACRLYEWAGGRYDEIARSQAALARRTEEIAVLQAWRDQTNSSDHANNKGPGFMSSLSDALTQVQQQQGATIENANAQQQANLQAIAEAKQRQQQQAAQQQQQAAQQKEQQQRQQQEQASMTAEQNARTAQATAAQSTATQPCTDMTGFVQGTARVGSDGWVSGSLTNNSNQTVHVFYTFKVNGAPSNNMANAGATTINAGQTVGGEGHGLYSTTADKNPGQIYWYAVLKSDHDQSKSCGNSHTW